MTKTRTLIRRPDIGKIAEFIDLDALKAYAERALLDVENWYPDADDHITVCDLFTWRPTADGWEFWSLVSDHFTVAPITTPKRPATRITEITAQIATLEAELRDLEKDNGTL